MNQPLLLIGSVGVDLAQQAQQEAQKLLCRKKTGCEECDMCIMANKGIHPDVLIYDAVVVNEKKRGIKELRDFLSRVYRSPLFGCRVVMIQQMDLLSVPAMNTLLKSLEEPPERAQYILTSHWPRRLLPTILSRCRVVRVNATPSPSLASRGLPLRQGEKTGEDEPLDNLQVKLEEILRDKGPNADLRLVYTRLRDFYRIKAARGNVKLARQVVVAALGQIDHNLAKAYDRET